ncbi:hypothetical protein [Vibrio fluvialis]|uniref:hypothetical protein n=1 Tax=Vibrio fluvialis TaxID=676 RepID=UPI0012DB77BE|nr:hypothetical protein [Vibrio fluvialis]
MTRKEKILYMFIVPLFSAALPMLFGWQTIAKLSGWIPLEECPGNPTKISISSPGNLVKLPFSSYGGTSVDLYNSSIIIDSSRPLSESYDVGVLTKGENDSQFRLSFFHSKEWVSPTRVRQYNPRLHVNSNTNDMIIIQAVVVDSNRGFGEYYSDVSQVTSNKSLIAISEPINIKLDK